MEKFKKQEMVYVAELDVHVDLVGVVENVFGVTRLANLHVHALSHVLIPTVHTVVFVYTTRKLVKHNAVSQLCYICLSSFNI